jgi:thioesterase domain-containing protein
VSDLFLIDSWVPGYFDRLPRVRGTIAALSLRAHLIFADWCRVLARETSMRNFINNRTIFKKLRALFSDAAAVGESNARPEETYDQWLLTYLQGLSARYEPRPYHGKITLFRSKREPTGFFFKEHAGWGDFTAAGVDVRFIDGNHFTMFQDPGAAQMAACVASVLDVVSPQASPASQS